MTFGDGREYVDALPVFPGRYHPHAPLTGPALGDALRIAYVHARHHGRLLLRQSAPIHLRAPRTSVFTANAVPTRIAEATVYLPKAITQLQVEVIYRVWSVSEGTSSAHYVEVTNGTDTDTSSVIYSDVANPTPVAAWTPPELFWAGTPALRSLFTLTLDDVDDDQEVEISVYGSAAVRRTSAGQPYKAIMISVWGDTR